MRTSSVPLLITVLIIIGTSSSWVTLVAALDRLWWPQSAAASGSNSYYGSGTQQQQPRRVIVVTDRYGRIMEYPYGAPPAATATGTDGWAAARSGRTDPLPWNYSHPAAAAAAAPHYMYYAPYSPTARKDGSAAGAAAATGYPMYVLNESSPMNGSYHSYYPASPAKTLQKHLSRVPLPLPVRPPSWSSPPLPRRPPQRPLTPVLPIPFPPFPHGRSLRPATNETDHHHHPHGHQTAIGTDLNDFYEAFHNQISSELPNGPNPADGSNHTRVIHVYHSITVNESSRGPVDRMVNGTVLIVQEREPLPAASGEEESGRGLDRGRWNETNSGGSGGGGHYGVHHTHPYFYYRTNPVYYPNRLPPPSAAGDGLAGTYFGPYYGPRIDKLPAAGTDRRVYAKTEPARDPKFHGYGTVESLGGRDVQLRCSFRTPGHKLISNGVWVKIFGPYDVLIPPSRPGGTSFSASRRQPPPPPFMCDRCRVDPIRWHETTRYKAATHKDVATLAIYNVQPGDYGLYRCSATAEVLGGGGGGDGEMETLYQIVQFKPPIY